MGDAREPTETKYTEVELVAGESVVIGEGVRVTSRRLRGGVAKLGVHAPGLKILRGEHYNDGRESGKEGGS